jgi:hypothetical protein
MSEDLKIKVLCPTATRQKLAPGEVPPGPRAASVFDPSAVNLAERLDTLENKILYLVDIGFGGGFNFMLEVQRWFNEHMPSVTTIPRRKPGHVFSDDNNEELWKEVKEKGNAVVLGVAG